MLPTKSALTGTQNNERVMLVLFPLITFGLFILGILGLWVINSLIVPMLG